MSAHHRTPEWQATRKAQRPKIEASLPQPCIECGGMIRKGDRWQVGHRVSAAVGKRKGWTSAQINAPRNLGPVHAKGPNQRACNQIEGGKLGAQIVNDQVRDATRLPKWW